MALTEFTVPNKNGSYDGGMVIKNYTSLNIAAGNTVSTDQPCRGMIIYVSGDCTISGTLTMTGRGAATPNLNSEVTALFNSVPGLFYPYLPTSGTPSPISGLSSLGYFFRGTESAGNNNIDSRLSAVTLPHTNFDVYPIYRVGANGGVAHACQTGRIAGNTGSAGALGKTGGGGSGGKSTGGMYSGVERGGNGTCFSGGAGSGGAAHAGPNSGTCQYPGLQGNDFGGAGGVATGYFGSTSGNGHTAGGGAGNPGGAPSGADGPFSITATPAQGTAVGNAVHGQTAGSNGTGGLLILIVGGDLTINSGGEIISHGSAGGNGGTTALGAGDSSAGGGSGGGHIVILHRGTYTNNGTVAANGGSGGSILSSTGAAGGAGGSGYVHVAQIL